MNKTITLTSKEIKWLYSNLENQFDVPEALSINKKLVDKKLVEKPFLTKREKFIVSAINPSVQGFREDGIKTNQKEIDALNKKCRSSHFDMDCVLGVEEFFACSPDGRKKFFEYAFSSPCSNSEYKLWKETARKAAELWSRGKCKQAMQVDQYNWNVNY